MKETNVIVRVSEQERRQMKAIAAEYGMGMSEFVRALTRYVREYRPRLVIEPKREGEVHVK